MAQTCTVIQADPWTLATQLNAITDGIAIVEKTTSAGKFLVVQDSTITPQTFVVIAGDPDKLASEITTLIGLGNDVSLVISTFSASHYVVAYS